MLNMSIGPMDTMDVQWTSNGRPLHIIKIVDHVHWCPLCPLDTLCPFNGQNLHVQWTQWTSIGSILMCPMDPLSAHQFVNLLLFVNPVQWTQCVHCAHCVHCTQCKWMSNGQNMAVSSNLDPPYLGR